MEVVSRAGNMMFPREGSPILNLLTDGINDLLSTCVDTSQIQASLL